MNYRYIIITLLWIIIDGIKIQEKSFQRHLKGTRVYLGLHGKIEEGHFCVIQIRHSRLWLTSEYEDKKRGRFSNNVYRLPLVPQSNLQVAKKEECIVCNLMDLGLTACTCAHFDRVENRFLINPTCQRVLGTIDGFNPYKNWCFTF